MPSAIVARPGPPGSASRRLAMAVAVLVLGFCAVSGAMLVELRRDTWKQALTGADNLLMAMSQDVTRNVELMDLSLQAVVDGMAEPALPGLEPRLQQMLLFDRAASAKFLGALLVLDENGDVVHDSGALPPRRDNFGDRAYFRAHRDRADAGLFVDGPFTRRLTGSDQVLGFSRRIERADGSFAGVAVGTLQLEYFRSLFDGASLGPRGAVSLVRTDGRLVMRTPYDPAQVGRDLSGSDIVRRFLESPAGVFLGTATLDGVRRVYSFTRLGELPLVLTVALSEDDIFAAWQGRAAVIGLVLLALCGTAAGLCLMLGRELRRRARTERVLRESEARFRLLANHATDVILRLDATLARTYVSPASLPVLGYAPAELVGGRPRDLIHPEDWPLAAERIAQARESRGHAEATYRLRHRDGHYLWVEVHYSCVAEDGGFIAVLRDISERKAAEERLAAANTELAQLARSDALTGLANRRCFDETLERECRRAVRDGTALSLLMLDVDRFKAFNDTYGHQAGDECLRQVGGAVGAAVRRAGDLAARYGGEEMALLLPGADEAGAARMAERVRAAVSALAVGHAGNPGCGSVVTVSVGCATILPAAGQDGGTAGEEGSGLVLQADRALYEAKRAGRNRVRSRADLPVSPVPPVLPDEEERLAALAAYEAEGAGGSAESLDRIAALTASLLGTPTAFVSLVGREEVCLTGRHGVTATRLPRATTLCAHTIAGSGPMVVPDTRADPRFAANPQVAGEGGMRFYAGAPLVGSSDGRPLGSLCIADVRPRPPLGPEQRALLTSLAGLVVDDMDRRRVRSEAPRAA